ncbi:uncharacterized protein BDW47DRAFT_21241 [Aspergillus candidus]|uniref:Uncharacterized protein n=1 Tax=Aspergillus candidus TaxID=41067 RepID=A0A2I2FD88_ASPCN|nr:hypothetical protein BDW47DRAFT_21241 [Aspergillus candidus]PLB38590.1 hypothetical protein BDW47DRAFT_21241 [Aspergillus candidus]
MINSVRVQIRQSASLMIHRLPPSLSFFLFLFFPFLFFPHFFFVFLFSFFLFFSFKSPTKWDKMKTDMC